VDGEGAPAAPDPADDDQTGSIGNLYYAII
jgi:hypothetical protein